jgi:hypothetical protein
LFGWAIVFEVEDTGEITNVYPARVKFRGFDSKATEQGYITPSDYLRKNAPELFDETNRGSKRRDRGAEMTDFIRVGKGIFVNLAQRIGFVSMVIPFGASYQIKQPSAEVVAQMSAAALAKKELQGPDAGAITGAATMTNPVPQDSDYIYPLFRALDAGLIEDYWIDFSKEAVVKNSMPLLEGQTIFTNHGKLTGSWGCRTLDVNDWIGVVNQVFWDEKGAQAGGIPGINNELKIDWTQDPKLARGLLMKPPAIKAVSVTPYFSWDASHPELLEQSAFWQNLGQQIEGGEATPACPKGNVVRLIVGEIVDYHEESLVVKGANAGSNRQIEPDETDEELSAIRLRLDEVMNERSQRRLSPPVTKPGAPALQSHKDKPNVHKENDMKIKLTAAQKKALGLANEAGEEFEDSVVLAALAAIEQRAVTAEAAVALVQPFIEAERAEVVRLATLAEGLTDDAQKVTLPSVFADSIKNATPAQLADWKTMYRKRVDEKFAPKCAKCGSVEISRRSSVEEGARSQEAPKTRIPKSGL